MFIFFAHSPFSLDVVCFFQVGVVIFTSHTVDIHRVMLLWVVNNVCIISFYSHFFSSFFINVAAERTSLQYSRSIKQKFNELFSHFSSLLLCGMFFTFLHRHHHFVKKGERETINDLFGKCIMSKVCIQNFFIFFYHTSLFIEYFSSFFTIMVFLKLSLNIFFNIKYRMYNNSMSTICV